jgi:hypothetical protein
MLREQLQDNLKRRSVRITSITTRLRYHDQQNNPQSDPKQIEMALSPDRNLQLAIRVVRHMGSVGWEFDHLIFKIPPV